MEHVNYISLQLFYHKKKPLAGPRFSLSPGLAWSSG